MNEYQEALDKLKKLWIEDKFYSLRLVPILKEYEQEFKLLQELIDETIQKDKEWLYEWIKIKRSYG